MNTGFPGLPLKITKQLTLTADPVNVVQKDCHCQAKNEIGHGLYKSDCILLIFQEVNQFHLLILFEHSPKLDPERIKSENLLYPVDVPQRDTAFVVFVILDKTLAVCSHFQHDFKGLVQIQTIPPYGLSFLRMEELLQHVRDVFVFDFVSQGPEIVGDCEQSVGYWKHLVGQQVLLGRVHSDDVVLLVLTHVFDLKGVACCHQVDVVGNFEILFELIEIQYNGVDIRFLFDICPLNSIWCLRSFEHK